MVIVVVSRHSAYRYALLDYDVDFDPERDIATFTTLPPVPDDPSFRPIIEGHPSPGAMSKIRQPAPGYDPMPSFPAGWLGARTDPCRGAQILLGVACGREAKNLLEIRAEPA